MLFVLSKVSNVWSGDYCMIGLGDCYLCRRRGSVGNLSSGALHAGVLARGPDHLQVWHPAGPRGRLKVLCEGPGSITNTGPSKHILWRVRVSPYVGAEPAILQTRWQYGVEFLDSMVLPRKVL